MLLCTCCCNHNAAEEVVQESISAFVSFCENITWLTLIKLIKKGLCIVENELIPGYHQIRDVNKQVLKN